MSLSIILVHPQLGENVGAAARVMKNFGMTDLRLVKPRDGWPNPDAVTMAAGGKDVVDAARVFDTSAEAIADLHHVYATTGRTRQMEKPVCNAREAAEEGHALADQKIGVLFGPERSGLENDDIALANSIISLPVNEEYPSLNLAQTVAIVVHEWQMAQNADNVAAQTSLPAEKQELTGMLGQLEQALDTVNFWKVADKKPVMWRTIQNMFTRMQLSSQEIRTLRGILRSLSDR